MSSGAGCAAAGIGAGKDVGFSPSTGVGTAPAWAVPEFGSVVMAGESRRALMYRQARNPPAARITSAIASATAARLLPCFGAAGLTADVALMAPGADGP